MDFSIKTVDQLRDHLRSLRKASGFTQKELGVRLGLGQVRIAEIESNPGSVSTEQLLRVLHALGAELAIQPNVQAPTSPPFPSDLRRPGVTQPSDASNPSVTTAPGQSLPSANVGARGARHPSVDQHAEATRHTFPPVLADIARHRLASIMSLSQAQSHDLVETLTQPHPMQTSKLPAAGSGDAMPAPRPVMVSPRNADELGFWADSFGVTTQELLDAIEALGIKAIAQTQAVPNKGAW